MPNPMQITLMRHGRSRADDEMVHEGRYDSPLTDFGRAQVRSRAEQWKQSGVTFDLIVASTLVRASESARIVGESLDVPIEYDPDWMERDNGPLAGLPFDVAKERYPRPDFTNPFQPFVPSTGEGESGWELMSRGARALQSVVRKGRPSTLVVAHGGILNAAMYCLLGVSPHPGVVRFAFGDACFVRTSYDPESDQWTIREMSAQSD
ncbi:MAG: histidine phosphatase family protein [Dehalococcoidia bacterium]|nr:histidine phosphatase family protein [Dehalococcoidia bacterium]